ncbi:hypothetical protein HPB48_009037 [Haemaphysalis longicornis]|uniref:Uncharacterized protein n=1 Tax=Haemaphysalis longicornis TaxID=44386 RepID=A0A9J6H3R9_HAELO|nr:hypothetical protein HPB48_009037 [Haemaphysalis longicornis]
MCSPQKSELLLYRPPGKRHRPGTPDVQLALQNRVIPIVPRIRVLGIRNHQSGSIKDTIKVLSASSLQISHLISRITHRYHGLKELNLILLVGSRIPYVTPYLKKANNVKWNE